MTMAITENALKVLHARYLLRDSGGQVVETPEELFRRVAHHVAQAETHFGNANAAARWEEAFHDALVRLDFLPNSPTLMNAGTPLRQLSACFVLPVEDSIESIFGSLRLMALIQKSGGGTGFSFSHLRPKGDVVAPTGGAASGPVPFMHIFDCATESMWKGGKHHGATMGVLRVDHPDIEEFIDAKLDGHSFRNFNISIGVIDAFMNAAITGPRKIICAFRRLSKSPRIMPSQKPSTYRTKPPWNDVAAIYRRAWEWGCKGITVYRYGSKGRQVLELGVGETATQHEHFARCDPQACKL